MKRAGLLLVTAAGLFGQATVPFVGCKSGGQVESDAPPAGDNPVLPISVEAARRLAYYSGVGGAVLAPRGWYCFGTVGSGGGSLSVSPKPFDVFAKGWDGFGGPAIDLGLHDSAAFGRFTVASLVARVFPAQWTFARKIAAESLLPPSEFVFQPYAKDQLTYKGDSLVEYRTPPQTEGLGTQSFLKKGADPIRGVAILQKGYDGPNVLLLSVRLPAELANLTDTIIQQVERDAQTRVK